MVLLLKMASTELDSVVTNALATASEEVVGKDVVDVTITLPEV